MGNSKQDLTGYSQIKIWETEYIDNVINKLSQGI